MNPIQIDTLLASVTRELETAGFHMLGDMRNLVRGDAGIARPLIARLLADDEGAVIAAVYPARDEAVAAGRTGSPHAIDLETPLDDGTFLTTSNAPAAAGMPDMPPQVLGECLAPGTDAATLLERHRLRVAEWLRTRPTVSPLHSRSADDALHHRQRLDDILAAFQGRSRTCSPERHRA